MKQLSKNMKDLQIIHLAQNEWRKYKKLRLKSLLTDPIAFATTYEQASGYSDEEWKHRLTYPGSIFTFAKYGTNCIGMVGVYTKDTVQADGVAVIVGVYVEPNFRGKGVGKLLMKRALEEVSECKEVQKIKVWVSETQIPAIALYKSFGFTFVEKKENEIFSEGNFFDELIMEKQLL